MENELSTKGKLISSATLSAFRDKIIEKIFSQTEKVKYVTEAEYAALGESTKTDGIIYIID